MKKIPEMSEGKYRQWLKKQVRYERHRRPEVRRSAIGREIDDAIPPVGSGGEAEHASQRAWMSARKQRNINDGIFFGLVAVGVALLFSGFPDLGTGFAALSIVWSFVQPRERPKRVVPRKFRK